MKILVILLLFFAGCTSDIQESTTWVDSYMEEAFKNRLTEDDIEFHTEGKRFFYYVRDREAVRLISSEIVKEYSPVNAFFFFKEEDLTKVKKEFDIKGIRYRIIQSDGGFGISWEEGDVKKARSIIRDVTGIPLDLDRVEKKQAESANDLVVEYSVITIKEYELAEAEKDFQHIGIDYKVLNTDQGYMIRWAIENNSKVMKMLESADYYYDPEK